MLNEKDIEDFALNPTIKATCPHCGSVNLNLGMNPKFYCLDCKEFFHLANYMRVSELDEMTVGCTYRYNWEETHQGNF
jgi:hypothetical protein